MKNEILNIGEGTFANWMVWKWTGNFVHCFYVIAYNAITYVQSLLK